MSDEKILFISSVACWNKLGKLASSLIISLHFLKEYGYKMVLLHDGLDTSAKQKLKIKLDFLKSQNVVFDEILSLSKIKSDFEGLFNGTSKIVNPQKLREVFVIGKTASKDLQLFGDLIKKLAPHLWVDVSRLLYVSFEKSEDTKNRNTKGKVGNKVGSWLDLKEYIITKNRIFKVKRKTKETSIDLELNLDGRGRSKIKTGLNFFDHMLDNFAKHSKVDLILKVDGDLEVDEHHTIEDTAIALAEAFKQALADKVGVRRYSFVLPMDESESHCSLDLSGRGHLEYQANFEREYVGDFPTELVKHFYYSFCINAGVNMNLKIYGENEHHKIESSFKAWAKCIKEAVKREGTDLPSTKGLLQ